MFGVFRASPATGLCNGFVSKVWHLSGQGYCSLQGPCAHPSFDMSAPEGVWDVDEKFIYIHIYIYIYIENLNKLGNRQ